MATLYVLAPSYFAQIANGILIIFFLYILLSNWKKIVNLEPIKLLQLISIFAIAIGIHGLLHLGLEKTYNYNPISLLFT